MISAERAVHFRNTIHEWVGDNTQWLGIDTYVARKLVTDSLRFHGIARRYRPIYFHCWTDTRLIPVAALPHLATLLRVLQSAHAHQGLYKAEPAHAF